MKKISLLLLSGIFLYTSVMGAEYSFVKEYKASEPLNLVISTTGGNITTSGYDKDVVEVAFIVKKRGQLLDIKFEDLEKYAEVQIINDNNDLEIKVVKTLENNISIGFDIKTPVRTSCSLHTSGGNVKLSGVNGTQEVRTSGGNLVMENITGHLDGKTSGGNVKITNIKADVIAKTSGGNVILENIEGKVEANTSGGNIKVLNSKSDVSASTSGGNVEITDAQGIITAITSGGHISLDNISGSVDAKTSGGSISADMVTLSDKLILKTSGGSIDANVPADLGMDLNLSANKVNTQLKNFSGSSVKGKVVGQMNGGGIRVEMSTSGGDITLKYK